MYICTIIDAKLDAVELLLHSFSSAATFLNPQATRCASLYSLNFDPSGTIIGASIQVMKNSSSVERYNQYNHGTL